MQSLGALSASMISKRARIFVLFHVGTITGLHACESSSRRAICDADSAEELLSRGASFLHLHHYVMQNKSYVTLCNALIRLP
jgi:hypothetical protein